tara:strand:- start:1066 stop:1590 length:525 start_codon:yes stop_codon:yes gene_type:complete
MTLSNSPLSIPGKLSPTGWEPPESLTYEEWEGTGLVFRVFEQATQWAIGDWIRVGEARFGDRYTQALDATEHKKGYLQNMVYVSEQVEPSRRREELTWSHHQAVSPLAPARQDELLEQAVSEGLTVPKLRAIVNPRHEDPPQPLEPGQACCPKCTFRFRLSENNHHPALTEVPT